MAANSNSSTTKKGSSTRSSNQNTRKNTSGSSTRKASGSSTVKASAKKGSGSSKSSGGRGGSSKRGNSTGRTTNKNTKAYEKQRQMEREEAMTPPETKREIYAVICFALNLILVLGTYGVCGKVGSAVSGFFFGIYGATFYVLPFAFFIAFCFLMANGPKPKLIKKLIWIFIFAMSIGFICQLVVGTKDMGVRDLYFDGYNDHRGGGVIFGGIIVFIAKYISRVGAVIVSLILLLISIVMFTGVRPTEMFRQMFDLWDHRDSTKYDEDYDEDYDDDDEEDLLLTRLKKTGMLHDIRVLDESGNTATSSKKAGKKESKKTNKIVPEEEMREILPNVDTSGTQTATPKKYLPKAESEIAMPLEPRRQKVGSGMDALEEISNTSAIYNQGVKQDDGPKDFFELEPDSRTYDDPLGSDTSYDDNSGKVIPTYSGPSRKDTSRKNGSGSSVNMTEIMPDYNNQSGTYDSDMNYQGTGYGSDAEMELFGSQDGTQTSVSARKNIQTSQPQNVQNLQSSKSSRASQSSELSQNSRTSQGSELSQNSRESQGSELSRDTQPSQAKQSSQGTEEDNEKVTRDDKLRETHNIEDAISQQEEPKKKYVFPPVSLLKQGGRYSYDRTGDA